VEGMMLVLAAVPYVVALQAKIVPQVHPGEPIERGAILRFVRRYSCRYRSQRGLPIGGDCSNPPDCAGEIRTLRRDTLPTNRAKH
jgi:hypothetical protein